jgi:hypothetical protein
MTEKSVSIRAGVRRERSSAANVLLTRKPGGGFYCSLTLRGGDGLVVDSWRSKAVVLTAFCSSPVRRARLSVKDSAMRKFIGRGKWLVISG